MRFGAGHRSVHRTVFRRRSDGFAEGSRKLLAKQGRVQLSINHEEFRAANKFCAWRDDDSKKWRETLPKVGGRLAEGSRKARES